LRIAILRRSNAWQTTVCNAPDRRRNPIVIEVSGLGKRFRLTARKAAVDPDPRAENGWFNAVRAVSFTCTAGEVLGLLGPNGAGKTTILRMLSTALAPSAGSIRVDGVDLIADPLAARRRIGFLSGTTGLYGRLTVRENVRYFGAAHGIDPALLDTRLEQLLTALDMHNYADRRVDALSSGMKQRAAIARTVIHAPSVLIFDEPTTGLDILGAQVVLDFMRERSLDRNTVVFSTHHLHEVDALCSRVCIVDQGNSVFEGSLDALRIAGTNGTGSLAAGYLAQLRPK
jgi:sodium transport system ATP-binding protein